jgi:hypothetical protein
MTTCTIAGRILVPQPVAQLRWYHVGDERPETKQKKEEEVVPTAEEDDALKFQENAGPLGYVINPRPPAQKDQKRYF